MICRIALEAYRQRQWPMEGTDAYDLEVALHDAQDYLAAGWKTFPHDDDVSLRGFIRWAKRILKG
jgi:hypothetical protein